MTNQNPVIPGILTVAGILAVARYLLARDSRNYNPFHTEMPWTWYGITARHQQQYINAALAIKKLLSKMK